MADQYGKKMKEGSSSIEDSNGISKIVLFMYSNDSPRRLEKAFDTESGG